MTKMLYIELFISLLIVFGTLAAIMIVRFFAKRAVPPAKGAKAVIKVYFDPECQCFEWMMERLVRSQAVLAFSTKIFVVDTECSDESRKWLETLRKKLDDKFDIVFEKRCDGDAKGQ